MLDPDYNHIAYCAFISRGKRTETITTVYGLCFKLPLKYWVAYLKGFTRFKDYFLIDLGLIPPKTIDHSHP